MSQQKFNPQANVIVLEAKIKARLGVTTRLVLDTGASLVMLPYQLAKQIGIKIDPTKTVEITTASTVEISPFVSIPKMSVLGKTATNVPCLIRDLPRTSEADGLLGLSFLRHFKLTLDFKKRILSLE